MARRSRRPKSNWRRDLSVRSQSAWDDYPDQILTVSTLLPRPVARKARREVYPYPVPLQKKLRSRVIRRALRRSSAPLVRAKVRIRIPRRLPLARGSYVSVNNHRLNIHSHRQLQALLAAGEYNRRRYDERKSHRRRARHGQLDSPGATGFGSVAGVARRGGTVNQLADAALVARAILKGRA